MIIYMKKCSGRGEECADMRGVVSGWLGGQEYVGKTGAEIAVVVL